MANKVIKTKSTEKVFKELDRDNQPKFKADQHFVNYCEYCGKEFTFTGKEVIDNVVKCPHCNGDNVVFLSQFK